MNDIYRVSPRGLTFLGIPLISKEAKYLLEDLLHVLQIELFLRSPKQNDSALVFKYQEECFQQFTSNTI